MLMWGDKSIAYMNVSLIMVVTLVVIDVDVLQYEQNQKINKPKIVKVNKSNSSKKI